MYLVSILQMLKRPNTYCPAYLKELEEVLQSEETLAYLKANRNVFQYIANHTGRPINKLSMFFSRFVVFKLLKCNFSGDVFQIYQTLTAEKTMNLTLPEWTKSVYPEKITEIAAKQCEAENHSSLLKRLNGG